MPLTHTTRHHTPPHATPRHPTPPHAIPRHHTITRNYATKPTRAIHTHTHAARLFYLAVASFHKVPSIFSTDFLLLTTARTCKELRFRALRHYGECRHWSREHARTIYSWLRPSCWLGKGMKRGRRGNTETYYYLARCTWYNEARTKGNRSPAMPQPVARKYWS
jgi:hypothetical protein